MDIYDVLIAAINGFISGLTSGLISLIPKILKWLRKNPIKTGGIIIGGIIIGIIIIYGILVGFDSVNVSDPSKHGFESGEEGWQPERGNGDSLGITEVAQSGDHANKGRHSLKLTANLVGGHPNLTKGEAFVQIDPFQNLENIPITAWVFMPRDTIGDPKRPNGIQLFVKDERWRSEYGHWYNIDGGMVDNWYKVTLTPIRSQSPDGYMGSAYIAPGFDPTQIRAIGIKVAVGDGSLATYNGPIYVDCIDY